MTSTVTMLIGDVRDVMATLPNNAFDVPDKAREIGSEPTQNGSNGGRRTP